jgi:hypothetical protein
VLCEKAIFDPSNRGSQNSDNTFITLNFIEVRPLSLHIVLIHYTGVDYFDKPVDARTDALDVLFTADYLLRTYPVSDFNFDGCEELEWNAKLAVASNFYALKSRIDSMRAMSGTNDVYIGLIPPAAGCSSPCGLGGEAPPTFSWTNRFSTQEQRTRSGMLWVARTRRDAYHRPILVTRIIRSTTASRGPASASAASIREALHCSIHRQQATT